MNWLGDHEEQVTPVKLLLLRHDKCLSEALYFSWILPKELLLFHWQVKEVLDISLYFLQQRSAHSMVYQLRGRRIDHCVC